MDKQVVYEALKRKEVVIDGHAHVGIFTSAFHQYGYPYALSLEDMVIRMKLLDLDHTVLFPFGDSFFYEKGNDSPQVTTTSRYCQFPYEIENKNLLNEVYEIFPQHNKKVLPFLIFDPSRETGKQAAHMAELSEQYRVFGLKTATTYIQAFVNDLETKGRPILDLAREKMFPMVFHSSIHPKDPWASVYDILGFAERNPDIRVCIAHTARFEKPVLDRADQLDNCYVDLSAFIIHCKLAVQDSSHVATGKNRFPADYSDPASAMIKLAEIYPNTILWGSDTPAFYWIQKYYSGDGTLIEDRLECEYDEEAQLLHTLPLAIKSKIAYHNTLRFIFG